MFRVSLLTELDLVSVLVERLYLHNVLRVTPTELRLVSILVERL